jgi:hypothetical protein
MRSAILVAALLLPTAVAAQTPPVSDTATVPQSTAPEATPPSASQINPQTNPGSPATTPAGTHVKHRRDRSGDTDAANSGMANASSNMASPR